MGEQPPKIRHRTHSSTRLRRLHMYQPATPLACMLVWVDGDQVGSEEVEVLGVEVRAIDLVVKRTHRDVLSVDPPPWPDRRLMRQDGWHPDPEENETTRHVVVIWDPEYQEPAALTEDRRNRSNFSFVCGPRCKPADWWRERLEEAVSYIRIRLDLHAKQAAVSPAAG